ncbi:MAG: hypothetical protein A2784_04680 [Candidatus Chisholmbacteria bacterium RIFCSPHIGHO2_01_FULL_48_12]|uniref:Glycosyltransferase RgtA/B/C/D-like domain-containing protein n=1 Tax=Candidatus Chisholmbacteria bacterium RIFCSPHIGHO2_01_FULL_48_12 TaxID=1797589 RepID=A0A1G1VMY2_9BACT|nr:MAG: hypothetical protein A2784_04680 [Candidatus Chisholmbacteria bacterium RIFCSPHIGHO2_01_FULL_48_12]
MKKYLPIILILLLAAGLRLVQLGQNPPGLYWDEVSLGYNAYSILTTGRDEHGEFLPLTRFKAFGDYKPPGYIYATVPSIALFGLNEFSVRFPSALAGVIMVWLMYLLVKELFPVHLGGVQGHPRGVQVATLAALILAISPWHVQLSRVAFEAMLAAAFNLAGIYFFVKAIHKSGWYLILSAIFFGLTVYTFNSNRLLTPLLVLALTLIYAKNLWAKKTAVIVAAIIGLVLALPLIPYWRSPESKLRWHEVNIFSDLKVILESNRRIAADGGGRVAKLIHHRYLGHAANFLHHYFDHFKGQYLWVTGDGNPRFSTQSTGQFYLIEALPLLVGLYWLLTRSVGWRTSVLLLAWFFLGPIPAATARETPHALRTVSMLPVPQIIIALGLSKLKKPILLLVTGILLLELIRFQYIYYRSYPQEFAGEWLTQYPPLVRYLKTVENNYDQIFVTSDFGRPYIYFLFYQQINPAKFQQEANVTRTGDGFGFFEVHSVGKYRFDAPDLTRPQPNTAYVLKDGNEFKITDNP